MRWPFYILAIFLVVFVTRCVYAEREFNRFAKEHDCHLIGRGGYMNRAFIYDCRGVRVESAHLAQ